MKESFVFSTFLLLNTIFLAFFVVGCGPSIQGQTQNSALEPPQKPETTPERNTKNVESIFTVIEIEDLEYPKLVASIRLPYRANPKNTVVLAAEHAYVATEKHLHVIDVSKPYLPSYLTSLAFSDEIGKVIASGNRLVVAGDKKFRIIDISVPTKPIIQSTTNLPNKNGIKDMDVQDEHLYVLGEDNYSLYIFSLEFRQPRFVRSKELAKRWWLLCPDDIPAKVLQFQYPFGRNKYSAIHEPLMAQRKFLQLHPSTHGIIRSTNEFLVTTDFYSKADDLPIQEIQARGGLIVVDACWVDEVRGIGSTFSSAHYYLERKYGGNISGGWKQTFERHKPKISHTIVDGKMQRIAPDPLIETVTINNRTYEGHVTDYQVSGNLIYIVSEKGFFSIFRFLSLKDFVIQADAGKVNFGKVLSTTPLQASKSISVAVGKQHAYVLTMPPEKEK